MNSGHGQFDILLSMFLEHVLEGGTVLGAQESTLTYKTPSVLDLDSQGFKETM